VAAPTFWAKFPDSVGVIFGSGISAAAIAAVLMNLLFNEIKAGNKPGASVFAAGTSEYAAEEIPPAVDPEAVQQPDGADLSATVAASRKVDHA
jgi:hypothetical protein